MRWVGHAACMGRGGKHAGFMLSKLERKIPLGRPRRRLEDNIKMDLRERGYDDMDSIHLIQDRVS
jgi:hypothetical protein